MKYLVSFAVSCLAAAVVLSVAPVHGEADIYDDVLRLHVIAESDSEEDQALKLKVRDAVLNCVSQKLADCASYEEAYDTVEKLREEIISAAEACVRENGGDSSVSLELGQEMYPTREYDSANLPAGVYNSLRIIIGDGEGKNWWCVLFPTICTGFARVADEEEYVSVGFTPAEYRVITGESGKVKVKFRILEIVSEFTEFVFGMR
ncbi:MAG: stage II sporulation protein R [Ruminococcaceae bacterium]|nr:stage II sporulation protein R [Oscillospiraceae bacterium]